MTDIPVDPTGQHTHQPGVAGPSLPPDMHTPAAVRVEALTEVAVHGRRRLERTNRTVILIVTVGMAIVLAATVIFGLISSIHQSHSAMAQQQELTQVLALAREVQDTTNPQSVYSKNEQTRVENLVTHIMVCIENHEDRVTQIILHVPQFPVTPGCP